MPFQLLHPDFPANTSHTSSILINQFLYWYLDMFLVDESGAYNSWDFVFYLTLGICGTTCYPFKWKAEFNLETPHCYADDEWWSGGWISKTPPKRSFMRRKFSVWLQRVYIVCEEKRRRFWYFLVFQSWPPHFIIDTFCNLRSKFI